MSGTGVWLPGVNLTPIRSRSIPNSTWTVFQLTVSWSVSFRKPSSLGPTQGPQLLQLESFCFRDDSLDTEADTEPISNELEEAGIEDRKQKEKNNGKKKDPELRKGPSLALTLFKTSQGPIIISALCRLFSAFWEFLNPILLQ